LRVNKYIYNSIALRKIKIKLLYIIYKFVKLFYEKPFYEDTIFISESLKIKIKTYLFTLAIFHKLKIS